MYKRALVTLDGSPMAEAILPFVTEIADPLDLEVVLLRVVVPTPPQAVEGSRHVVVEDIEGRNAEAREYLAALAAELVGAELIAMAAHGRSGLGRVLFGSVAETVLREVEIPVFLMRVPKSLR